MSILYNISLNNTAVSSLNGSEAVPEMVASSSSFKRLIVNTDKQEE
jgi:hypothetical protein